MKPDSDAEINLKLDSKLDLKLDLKKAASEYAAGELSSAECTVFEEHLRADPLLVDEVAFWRKLRGGLTPTAIQPLTTPGVCPDLCGTLLRRARLERSVVPARRLQLPRWVMAASAAAACLALGLGFGAGAAWTHHEEASPAFSATHSNVPNVSEIAVNEPIAYGEDGSAMTPPPATVAWRTFMPLSAIDQADANLPLPMTPVTKPWVGLWTKQARLIITGAPAREAHLVVRIVGGSPAWQSGLRPGDMIIGIDDCAVDNALCLGEHLAGTIPGSIMKLEYWSANDAAFRKTTMKLEAVHE